MVFWPGFDEVFLGMNFDRGTVAREFLPRSTLILFNLPSHRDLYNDFMQSQYCVGSDPFSARISAAFSSKGRLIYRF